MTPSIFKRPDAPDLAYHQSPGDGPGIVFLGGFMSDMTGTKATALEAFCRERGQAFLRFDYRGHGASQGTFAEAAIGDWLADSLTMIDHFTTGPQILVGSSMGGWLALLAARARPQRIAALVGIAPAPDFTRTLIESELDAKQVACLERDGFLEMPSDYGETPYIISKRLIDEGRDHLLMGGPISLAIPVRLLHGMEDTDVPWRLSLDLAEKIDSKDVTVTLIKYADHRLSDPASLERLFKTLKELTALCRA